MSTALNDKIEQVKTARDAIKTALYNKTGETQSDDIRTYANKISNIDTVNNEDKTIVENGTYTAGQDYTGFGEVVVNVPQGPDTSDATANINDIINPKTAYVNGNKITGAMLPSYDYSDIVPEDLDEINFGSMPTEIDRENGYVLYIDSDTIRIKKINTDKSLTEIITIVPTDLSSSATHIYNATFVITEGLIRIITNGYNDKKIYLLEYNLTTYEQITKTSIAHDSYNYWGADTVAYKFSPINPNEFVAYALSRSDASVYYYTINSSKAITLATTKTAGGYGIGRGKLRTYFSNDGKYLYCYASYVYTGNRFAPYYFSYIFSVASGGVLTSIISRSNEVSYGSFNGGAYYMLDNGLVYEAWATTPTVYKISGNSLTQLYTTDIRISDHSSTSSTMFNTSSNFLCALGDYLIFRYTGNVRIYKVTEQALILYKTVSADKLLVNHNKSVSYGTSPSFSGLILNPENAKLIGLIRNGFSYIDTSNANATSGDILISKTAFVNNQKVTGTMPNNGTINITPSTTQQTIPTGYTSGGTVAAVTSSIDQNIIAENIKRDVEILGVTGTLESSSGDVKLFDTVDQMQEDTSAEEGDLAVVYREEIQPVTEESEFDTCVFPNEVVLAEAFSSEIYGSFRAINQDVIFDGMVEMSSSSFVFNGYGDSIQISVEYESQDGITYTRVDGGEELQEFGTTIKWEPYEEFNNVIGNFMKTAGNYFDGFYEYKLNQKTNKIHPRDLSTAIINVTSTEAVSFSVPNLLSQVYDLDQLQVILDKYSLSNGLFYVDTNNQLKLIESQKSLDRFVVDSSGNILGVGIVTMETIVNSISVYDVNLQDKSLSNPIEYSIQSWRISSYNYYWYAITDMKSLIFYPGISTSFYMAIIVQNTSQNRWCEQIDTYVYTDRYILIYAQLNALENYVYEKTFYGKNGIKKGTLGTNISSTFNDTIATLYAKTQTVYDSIPSLIANNDDKRAGLDRNIVIIPSKSDGTPLLNTSNVTDMSEIFAECSSLTSVSLLDTQNVINMNSAFHSCSSLISIPLLNTSSVTDMSAAFHSCSSLISVPEFNTGNVINMHWLFMDCSSLTSLPLLNTSKVTDMGMMCYGCSNLINMPQLNTDNVATMGWMFTGCTSLTSLPLLNTNNVTDMHVMFSNCTSLSNESLNNILAMCINAVKITSNKTLSYIGLSQSQAIICQNLSNYQTFLDSGWTAGY